MLRIILVTLALVLAVPAAAEPWIHNRNPRNEAWGEIDFDSISTFKADGYIFIAAYAKFCHKDLKPNCYVPESADKMMMIVPAVHCAEGKGNVRGVLFKGEKMVNAITKRWSKDTPTVGAQTTWFLCRLAMQKAKGARGI